MPKAADILPPEDPEIVDLRKALEERYLSYALSTITQRALPEGLRFRLWLEGREVVLKPGLPDRSDTDENQKFPPQVTVLWSAYSFIGCSRPASVEVVS